MFLSTYIYLGKRSEAVVQMCSIKKVLLEILQNSQGNTCVSLCFNNVAGLRSATLSKKRLWQWCFHVNFTKFLRTPFVVEYLWWLLLNGPSDDVYSTHC